MRVVLFGAGASYGSGEVYPFPPPLGYQLFGQLRQHCRAWARLPEALRSEFATNFESGMATLIRTSGYDVPLLMREMAIYFSQFKVTLATDNLYRTVLASTVDRRDILWSSLNYECILEYAAGAEGREVAYFADPAECGSSVPAWKLHGSCNFQLAGIRLAPWARYAPLARFGGRPEFLAPDTVRQAYSGHVALYPCMALYARGKPVAMAPDLIEAAQARWAQAVLRSDRVLIIGVAPNPQDEHLWRPLAESPAQLAFVGDERVLREWTSTYRRSHTRFLGGTWAMGASRVMDFLNN